MTDKDAGCYDPPPLCLSPTHKEIIKRLSSGRVEVLEVRMGALWVWGGVKEAKKDRDRTTLSTLTGIDISVDLYIDMQVIFSLFEDIYNNYITQRIQFQFDKIASIQYSILLLLFMIT